MHTIASRPIIALFCLGCMLATLAACQDGSELTAPQTNAFDTDEAIFLIDDPAADPVEITEPTIESAMAVRRPQSERRKFGMKSIFRQLELTDEQKESLKEFGQAKRDCASAIIEDLRATEQPLIDALREERAAILESLRNDEITRDAAREQLRTLYSETRAELQENPAREEAREALQGCKDVFVESVQSILNDEQLELFNEWIENH